MKLLILYGTHERDKITALRLQTMGAVYGITCIIERWFLPNHEDCDAFIGLSALRESLPELVNYQIPPIPGLYIAGCPEDDTMRWLDRLPDVQLAISDRPDKFRRQFLGMVLLTVGLLMLGELSEDLQK